MTLDSILDELQTITGNPISVCRDESALTNSVYKITNGDCAWSLRINNKQASQLGISRERERVVIDSIQTLDWSPIVTAQHENYLLTSWCDGEPFKPETEQHLDQLASAIRNIQQVALTEETEPLKIDKQLALLITQVENLDSEFQQAIYDKLGAYQPPDRFVLCHHDWHPGNVLTNNNQLTVLDWEYAALGDPLIELACVSQGFKLTVSQERHLLTQLGMQSVDLSIAHSLTEAMSLLWYLVRFPEDDWSEEQHRWMMKWAGKN